MVNAVAGALVRLGCRNPKSKVQDLQCATPPSAPRVIIETSGAGER
jgi:hypothetical protein